MRPLDGLSVLDLSRLVAGGMLTTVLADFGAEVVKVEQPKTGDTLREWTKEGVPLWWQVYARNKKSITLNLSTPAGQTICRRLAQGADLLVESFVPGTLERWGLGPDDLLAVNPNLTMIRISGWGQDGPYAARPGFGTLVEAMSGFASLTGFPDRPPVLPPIPLADMVAALYGAAAALIALRARDSVGGQVIDLSLFEPLFSILGPQAAEYARFGSVRPRIGNLSHNAAPRNTYRSADGTWFAVSASTQAMAERLFAALGLEALAVDPKFRTNAARLQHREELDGLIAAEFARRSGAELVEVFTARGVTAVPVYDVAQIMADPHFAHRGVVVAVPDEEGRPVAMHPVIPRLSKTPGAVEHTGPALGAHNREIYGRLGMSAAELAALEEAGVV